MRVVDRKVGREGGPPAGAIMASHASRESHDTCLRDVTGYSIPVFQCYTLHNASMSVGSRSRNGCHAK